MDVKDYHSNTANSLARKDFYIDEDWLWQYPITGGYAIPICKADEIKKLIDKLNLLALEHNIEVKL